MPPSAYISRHRMYSLEVEGDSLYTKSWSLQPDSSTRAVGGREPPEKLNIHGCIDANFLCANTRITTAYTRPMVVDFSNRINGIVARHGSVINGIMGRHVRHEIPIFM